MIVRGMIRGDQRCHAMRQRRFDHCSSRLMRAQDAALAPGFFPVRDEDRQLFRWSAVSSVDKDGVQSV